MYPNIHNATPLFRQSHSKRMHASCIVSSLMLRVSVALALSSVGRCAHDSFCIFFLCNFWWPPLAICNWTNCGYVIESFLWFFWFLIFAFTNWYCVILVAGEPFQRIRNVYAAQFISCPLFASTHRHFSHINWTVCIVNISKFLLLFLAAEKHQHVERIEPNCDQHREHSECQQKGWTEDTRRGE